MSEVPDFYYEPEATEPLGIAVVSAVAEAHDEAVTDQQWVLNQDVNPDAIDGLFQQDNPEMAVQFKADSTTVTITTDDRGKPIIKIESHR